jgi:hypothetical protein
MVRGRFYPGLKKMKNLSGNIHLLLNQTDIIITQIDCSYRIAYLKDTVQPTEAVESRYWGDNEK